jgi:transcriptional regulator with XRE-family HTH domain
MAKAQHSTRYRSIPPFLRRVREEAGLTQRALGERLRRPQSWVYNCETANRRVDVAELAGWCRACGIDPLRGIATVLGIGSADDVVSAVTHRVPTRRARTGEK